MADDDKVRSYRSHASRRAGASADARQNGAEDPLAELARLIGKSDPFADIEPGRRRNYQAPPSVPEPANIRHLYQDEGERLYAPPDPRDLDDVFAEREAAAATRYGNHHDRRQYDELEPDHDPRRDPEQDLHRDLDLLSELNAHQDLYQDPDEVPHRLADEDYDERHAGARYGEPSSQDSFDSERFAAAETRPMLPDEGDYDDPPRAPRYRGLVTAIVLIGCAMLGTVGAYGFRTYHSGVGSGQVPPVIVADTSPTKVIPSQGELPAGKAIQDRVGDQGAGERIVSRQEEPLQLRASTVTPAARVVLPAGTAAAPQLAAPSTPGQGEPKKVRTVTIRPEGLDTVVRPATGLAAAPPAALAIAPQAARAVPAAKAPAPARTGSGPLSLDPQSAPPGEPQAATGALPRTRTALAPASDGPQLASAPTTVAAAQNPATAGGFVVQLTSQRSEADAQSSFRTLQTKFPGELGSRQAIIRRADLGQKGIYYRAMVGPFGSQGDADQFCSGLKAAGGQCIIQKN
jgi:hypothetical protein